MLNNLIQIHLKLLQKKTIKKTAEGTGDSFGNKIADKITRVSKPSLWNKIMKKKYLEKYLYLQN